MTTPVIAIANQKGGVGKSSILLQLAFYLAQRASLGRPILVIDMDYQGNTSTRLAQSVDLFDSRYTRSYDLFSDEEIEINPWKVRENIELIHARRNDDDLPGVSSLPQESITRPAYHLRKIIESGKYAAILVDSPPGVSHPLFASLAVATHVFAPIEVSGFATDGIDGLITSVDRVREINPELEFGGVFVNKFNSRSRRHLEAVASLRGALGDIVFNDKLGNRSSIDEASTDGVPVWSFSKGAARTAYKEVEAIIHEIMDRSGIVSTNSKFRMRNTG